MKMLSAVLSPQRLIFGILTFVCMVTIFCFSNEDASLSSSKSGDVTETIVEIVVDDYKNKPASEQMSIHDKAEHIVRKCAHFTIFMILGFMASCTVGRRKLFGWGSLGTLVFCFVYACSDEFHQRFVPGRSCMFTDVLIDTSGALIGIILSIVCMMIVHKLSLQKKESVG